MNRLLSSVGLVLLAGAASVWAEDAVTRGPLGATSSLRPVEISGVGLEQKITGQVPLDVQFTDEHGRVVPLSSFFHGRPVILTLNYYRCPMLCTQELNGLLKSLRALSWTAGKEFDVVTVSIDPLETPTLAAEKKLEYLSRYKRPEGEQGWHFLTGSKDSIQKLAAATGFQFKYIEQRREYSHPAAITVLTPTGKIARYLLGIEFSARDLKFGLMDAAAGKVGSTVDQVLLYCFHYDPMSGKYTVTVLNIIRVASALTFVALMGFVMLMLRRDRKLVAV